MILNGFQKNHFSEFFRDPLETPPFHGKFHLKFPFWFFETFPYLLIQLFMYHHVLKWSVVFGDINILQIAYFDPFFGKFLIGRRRGWSLSMIIFANYISFIWATIFENLPGPLTSPSPHWTCLWYYRLGTSGWPGFGKISNIKTDLDEAK